MLVLTSFPDAKRVTTNMSLSNF